MKGRIKITKAEWANLGGLRNSSIFRVERNGRWHYYKAV